MPGGPTAFPTRDAVRCGGHARPPRRVPLRNAYDPRRGSSPGHAPARAGPAHTTAHRDTAERTATPRKKITVYVSEDELLALEQTRLVLRADYGLTVDRGRIVREAIAVLLADFEEYGESSMLVQRLSDP